MHPVQEALLFLLGQAAKHPDPRMAAKATRLEMEIAALEKEPEPETAKEENA